jgi:hypothetical protein
MSEESISIKGSGEFDIVSEPSSSFDNLYRNFKSFHSKDTQISNFAEKVSDLP